MKFEKQVIQEINVKFIDIVAPVRYGEEDIPNDFPGRVGDTWMARVEIETGKIVDWTNGVAADFSMKVVDEGSYHLIDENNNSVASIEEDYVPNGVIPGEYGDYIEMEINEQGVITNWPKSPDLSAFNGEEED